MVGGGAHSPALPAQPPVSPLTHEDDDADSAQNGGADEPADPESVPV